MEIEFRNLNNMSGAAVQNRPFSSDDEVNSEGWLFCAFCGSKIVKQNEAVVIDGSHDHMFTNPSGINYHIRCFSNVENVALIGDPSSENTWFKGFEWTVATCVCGMHIGWKFSSGDNEFFALVSDNLTTESE